MHNKTKNCYIMLFAPKKILKITYILFGLLLYSIPLNPNALTILQMYKIVNIIKYLS